MTAYEHAEHAGKGAGFLAEYVDLLTDPAHLAAELTMLGVEAAILTPLIGLAVRAFVRRHDARHHPRPDRRRSEPREPSADEVLTPTVR